MVANSFSFYFYPLSFFFTHFPPSPDSLTLVHFQGVPSIFPTYINLYKYACARANTHIAPYVYSNYCLPPSVLNVRVLSLAVDYHALYLWLALCGIITTYGRRKQSAAE